MEKGTLEQRFDRFSTAVRESDALERKTNVLLHLGTAMAVGCDP